MKPPIKETPDQIIIDKAKVESLTKRFLAPAKALEWLLANPETGYV